MSTILITGGAGSIGRELARVLSGEGYRVRVMDLPGCDFRPLEGLADVEVVRGDILDRAALARAAADVDTAVHLAALLPPHSERDHDVTWRVNVQGTRQLMDALPEGAHLVLSSSVCVYGDTQGEGGAGAPIATDFPTAPFDLYGQSKVAAERAVRRGRLPYTVLRISGVAVPAFLAPPDPWPFRAAQRIEFVARGDVVAALRACVGNAAARDRTLHVAGGPTWRLTGDEYVARFNEVMGLDLTDANYCPGPCAFDWYESDSALDVLGYAPTPLDAFLAQLDDAIQRALGA